MKAIQVNFADHNFNIHAPHGPVVYQYYIEGSVDGNKWTRLVNERKESARCSSQITYSGHTSENAIPENLQFKRYGRLFLLI